MNRNIWCFCMGSLIKRSSLKSTASIGFTLSIGCTKVYRFTFNGKENDNEVKGNGNQQDYGMRVYDTRLGKFLSADPLTAKYPFYSPYQFAGNMPIKFIDLDGSEPDLCPLNFGDINTKSSRGILHKIDFKSVLSFVYKVETKYTTVILSEENKLIKVPDGGKATDAKMIINGGNTTDKVEVTYDMYDAPDKMEIFTNGNTSPTFETDGFVSDGGFVELPAGSNNLRILVTPAKGETNSGYEVNVKYSDERVMKTNSVKLFGLTLFKTRSVLSADDSRKMINNKKEDDNIKNDIPKEIEKPIKTKVSNEEIKL